MSSEPVPRERRCSICHVTYRNGERFCSLDAGPIVEVAPADAIPDPLIGTIIDERYFMRRFIGKGGMGAVYEADHVGLDRKVAVKVMLRGATDGGALARFRREARAASRVTHEHVVQIFDVGSGEGGVDYLAMELVEGRDLARVLKETGALDAARAVAIARGMLRGLHAIHEAGIVHRDVKPGNVLLATRDGNPEFVKIMDFGISKSLVVSDSITLTGQVVGTPTYMAPEQLMDEDVDRRADLYAVGITLYLMLAGTTPFVGTTGTVVGQQVYGEVPPLSGVRAGLPPALVAAVMRALEKERTARYADALEFIAALDVAASALPPPQNSDALVTRPLTAGASDGDQPPPERTARQPATPPVTGAAATVGIKRGTGDGEPQPPPSRAPVAPAPPTNVDLPAVQAPPPSSSSQTVPALAPVHARSLRWPIAIVAAVAIAGASVVAGIALWGRKTVVVQGPLPPGMRPPPPGEEGLAGFAGGGPPGPGPLGGSPLEQRCAAMASHVTQHHLQAWFDDWDTNLSLPTAHAIVPRFADTLLGLQTRILRDHCVGDVWDFDTIACMQDAPDDTDCEFPRPLKHKLYSAYERELVPAWRGAIDGSPELAAWVHESLKQYAHAAYAAWHKEHQALDSDGLPCPDKQLRALDAYMDPDRRSHGADPYGGDLDYTCSEAGVSVISKGPDHRAGTADDLQSQ